MVEPVAAEDDAVDVDDDTVVVVDEFAVAGVVVESVDAVVVTGGRLKRGSGREPCVAR
jgi:hypothetical protein